MEAVTLCKQLLPETRSGRYYCSSSLAMNLDDCQRRSTRRFAMGFVFHRCLGLKVSLEGSCYFSTLKPAFADYQNVMGCGLFQLCPAAEELASPGCSFVEGPIEPQLDSRELLIPTARRLFIDCCREGLASVS